MRPGIFSSVSLFVLMALVPNMAFAGFEFVAPGGSQKSPAVVSAPVDPIASPSDIDSAPLDMASPIEPVVNNARSAAPLAPIAVPLTPVVKNSDALSIETQPLDSVIPKPIAARPVAAPVAVGLPTRFTDTGNMSEGGNVQGFGRDVPLAIALQQIVPPSYRYDFEAPINPSMRISWSGNKPWKSIIADIARMNDMNVDIASNVVSFSRHKPMDMIAAGSSVNSSADMVQGVPLRPVAGQKFASAPALPDPVMSDLPAPVMMSDTVSAPKAIAAPTPLAPVIEAPRMADAAPSAPIAAPRNDISDLVFDNHSSGRSSGMASYGAQPATKAPTPIAAPTTGLAPVKSGRTELASISDQPLEPISSPSDMNAPTSILPPVSSDIKSPEAPKSAFFDGLMDEGTPAKGSVKEKKILTADASSNAMPAPIADSSINKPLDILEPNPLLAPAAPKPSSQFPSPASTNTIRPLPPISPPIMGNQPTDIAKQIDNSPVAANDLPLPIIGAPPVVSELPNIQPDMKVSREWSAKKNDTLRQTLTAWAEQAGTSLVWSSEYDYPLQTDVRIQSGYTDAVRTLLDGFSKAEPRPIGRLFKNDKVGAQPVLIIETQRLTN